MKPVIKEFFLGFIRLHILHHADKEEIYGAEFVQELKRHGYEISYGTLYPIFHSLEKKGYLRSRKSNVAGHIRRYYRITPQGKKTLKEAKPFARELIEEVCKE